MTQLTDSDTRALPDSDIHPPGSSSATPREDRETPTAPGTVGVRTGATPDLDELRLAAEEAEAEAVAAEAVAVAAKARAMATRLRRQAVAAETATTATGTAPAQAGGGVEPATESRSGTVPQAAVPAATAGPVLTKAGAADPACADATARTTVPSDTMPVAPTDENDADLAVTGCSEDTGIAGDSSAGDGSEAEIAVVAPRRPRWLPGTRALVGAFAVALIAVSGTVSGLLVQHHRHTVQADQREVEFTEAARQGVVALTSLDFSRAEQDVARVLEHSTGAFRDDFAGRAQDFTSVIQQSQVATAGTVNAAAVESMTEDSAVVLIAATSQVTNSAGAQGEPRAWRLSVTVTREGDTIKMSKVEFVP